MTTIINPLKVVINYLVENDELDKSIIINTAKQLINLEENNGEVINIYRMLEPLCKNDHHFLLASAIRHIDRSPENEIESNAKYALALLDECRKINHDPQTTSLYYAKAFFACGDDDNSFKYLSKYFKLNKRNEDEVDIIVVAVPSSEISQIEKRLDSLRKKGYSLFIKEIDEKQHRRLISGIIYDWN